MPFYEILLGVFLILVSVAIIVIILMQESRQQGLSGAIVGGSADTFFDRNKGRTKEARMTKVTKYLAVSFFVLVLVSSLLLAFLR